MQNFDKKSYLTEGKLTVDTFGIIEDTVEKVWNADFENIFLIASGGSLAIMEPVQYALKQLTTLPIYIEVASEVVLTGNKQLTEKSLVITASKSGTTKETVAMTKWCKERNIKIFALVGKEDSPLYKLADFPVIGKAKDAPEYEYMQLYLFLFGILHKRGEFSDYDLFKQQLPSIIDDFARFREEFSPKAEKIAKSLYNVPYQLWIGSGSIWGEIYSYTMCVLEEMQWLKTKAVTSAEFFHGTLEIVEDDTPVVLVKTEDETRNLDDRVEKFLPKINSNHFVVDLGKCQFTILDNRFKKYMMAPLCSVLLGDCLSSYYEIYSGHSLDIRRYYRVMDY